ncbi:hypothetical protein EOI86_21390 [Hwanghaeella grinnelliae]|uniref:Chemotaxis protein n=1 Tax=Hwanghaeella grinnelliae TaxID=2500179 RepID=A0A437QH20_9PROT|nr:hypothetical protein [Hwanghaeella grinnelliae]RVU33706.1 hypothetical protein EOI86_21390 [Hwanghaeella grinnelliae]
MDQGREKDRKVLLGALRIATAQKEVVTNAQAISLEAMNAKSLVSRAGETARAIRPLTDQIDEFARKIIALIEQIRAAVIEVSRNTLATFTERVVAEHMKHASDLGRNSKFIGSVGGKLQAVTSGQNEIRQKALASYDRLSRLLDDIGMNLLAASVVVSKFRLEVGASDGPYTTNFESLVDKLNESVVQSRNSISESEIILQDCIRVLRR